MLDPRHVTLRAAGLGTAAAVLALSLASCGTAPINRTANSGSETATTVNGVQVVNLQTGDDYRFHPSTFTVHTGKVQVILHNTGKGAPHDFQVVGFPATFVPLAQAGQTMEASFTMGSAGTYKFECTIHVEQGQIGKMIVTSG